MTKMSVPCRVVPKEKPPTFGRRVPVIGSSLHSNLQTEAQWLGKLAGRETVSADDPLECCLAEESLPAEIGWLTELLVDRPVDRTG